jgi:carbon monoxide dehydrogenase subunit G
MKWLLIVVVTLAALVVAVTVAGLALPQNHVAVRSAHLSVAPDKVWSIVTDPEKYPAWRSDVSSVEMLSGPDGGKISWREVSPKGNKLAYEATIVEAPTHFVTVIADKGIPFGGSWDYRIIPEGAGSRITITENGEVYNPIFRFVSRYVIGHTATLDKYLSALATKVGDTYLPSGKA